MAVGLSDQERARLADLSRRRSARLLLVALALLAAVQLVFVVLGMSLGSTDQLADVAVSLLPLAVVALIGLALHLRNRSRPLLLLGAEPDIQRRITQALRDGHAPDPYVDALATDLAVRQAKQPWPIDRREPPDVTAGCCRRPLLCFTPGNARCPIIGRRRCCR